MSCDQIGKLLLALVLITVSSFLYFWWHAKSCFNDIKSLPKGNELKSLLVFPGGWGGG